MSKPFSVRTIAYCALFAALIAAGAFIQIPLPALPITFQTMFVLLAGMLLGPGPGMASCAVYLAVGLAGLPVFTRGGGFGYVLQPSFGFIIGFCFGALITGWFVKRTAKPGFRHYFAAGLAGTAAIYLVGMTYFWLIYRFIKGDTLGIGALFSICFLPVIPGDIAMLAVGSLIAVRLRPVLQGRR